MWKEYPAHNIPAPKCANALPSRDNHLGNTIGGNPATYNWSIPDKIHESCVLRIRYCTKSCHSMYTRTELLRTVFDSISDTTYLLQTTTAGILTLPITTKMNLPMGQMYGQQRVCREVAKTL